MTENQNKFFKFFINSKLWNLFLPINENKLNIIKTNLNIQKNVIKALIYRELKTRISNIRFGILGLFIEPIGVVTVFVLFFAVIRGRAARPDMDTFLFLTVGIVFFTLFFNIAIRSVNSMEANKALFFYRSVKPIDTVIARSIVETGLYSIVLIVMILGIFFIKEIWTLDNFFILTTSFLTLSFFSFNIGLFLMIAGHRYPIIKQIMPLFMRPLFFVSGVFFSINSLPPAIRPWLSWNPILQSIEIARNALTEDYFLDPNIISFQYFIWISLLLTGINLFIYSNNERILLTR